MVKLKVSTKIHNKAKTQLNIPPICARNAGMCRDLIPFSHKSSSEVQHWFYVIRSGSQLGWDYVIWDRALCRPVKFCHTERGKLFLCTQAHCPLPVSTGQTQIVTARSCTTEAQTMKEISCGQEKTNLKTSTTFNIFQLVARTKTSLLHYWGAQSNKQNLKRIYCFEEPSAPILQMLSGGWCSFLPCYLSSQVQGVVKYCHLMKLDETLINPCSGGTYRNSVYLIMAKRGTTSITVCIDCLIFGEGTSYYVPQSLHGWWVLFHMEVPLDDFLPIFFMSMLKFKSRICPFTSMKGFSERRQGQTVWDGVKWTRPVTFWGLWVLLRSWQPITSTSSFRNIPLRP